MESRVKMAKLYSFLRINNRQPLKTLREKEKLFVMSNLFFSFNQITVSPFVHIFYISLFAVKLEEPKIGKSGKGLTLEQIENINFVGDKLIVTKM